MTTLPQTLPQDFYATGLDENGDLIGSRVDASQLSYIGVYGQLTNSGTENTIGGTEYGVKYFTLDDAMDFAVDDPVQIKSNEDPLVYTYGIITALDFTIEPVQIAVLCLRNSALSGTYTDFQIQKVPNFASEIGAVLGYSSDSKIFGAGNDIYVGAAVSMTTDTGKLMNAGSHIVVTSPVDATQFFRGISSAYDSSTGAILIFVTDVGSAATGTNAAWVLWAQDGPAVNTQLIATSSTPLTIGTGSKTFTTQADKGFQTLDTGTYFFGCFVLASDANDSSNYMLGYVTDYTGTSISLKVYKTGGSGTKSNWILQQMGPLIGSNIGGVTGPSIGPLQLIGLQNSANGALVLGLSFNDNTQTTDRGLSINIKDGSRTLTISADATISGTNTGDQIAPVAVYSATVTPTAVSGSVSSVNATTNVVTWSTTHNLTTGEQVRGIGTVPAGWTVGQMYFANALTTTTFALYLTLANALANTNRVDITATTTGATMVKLVYSNVYGFGLSAVSPVAGITGTTDIGLEFNLATALTSGMATLTVDGIVASGAGYYGVTINRSGTPTPTMPISGQVISFTNANIPIYGYGGPAEKPGAWAANQVLNAFTVILVVYGA